ncbi:MAG: hypothetical protein ABIQ31_13630 [Ferruginibacter sp.]
MAKYLHCMWIFLLIKTSCLGQSYGLSFNSHEVVLEKRTSLDLSPKDSFCFEKNFDLSFDLSFLRNYRIYFGYVFRIVSDNNENIDLIYNQPLSAFQVIIGENFSGISFSIDSLQLYREWNTISLKCDLENNTLQCSVNKKPVGTIRHGIKGNCFKFLWGANDFQKFKTRDIPPMQVKDIRVSEKNKLKYFWPLDETAGTVYEDKINHKPASIKNPVWLKNQHQNWQTLNSFTIKGYAGVAFDSKKDQLYVTGSDSVAVYTLKNENHLEWLSSAHQNLRLGHQNIFDISNGQLLDSYVDDKKVVSYEFNNRRWDFTFDPGPVMLTKYWHSNKFINPSDTSLYTIGGYGYLKYKNLVQRYNIPTKQWDSLTPSGDYFSPRYLSALGTDKTGRFVYILGGYGSQTGDQMLDPRYYYDLFRYDIKENLFKKICNFKPANPAFTFANSLVIDSNNFYGLVFSNDRYNSALQLIKGSLTDSVLQELAGPIPYNFHDIQSFADLYYSAVSNKLIVVTLFYSPEDPKEQSTEVKIYTLNFPPVPLDVSSEKIATVKKMNWFLSAAIGAAFLLVIAFLFRKKWRKPKPFQSAFPETGVINDEVPQSDAFTSPQPYLEKNLQSAIYLFGQFQVFDKEGNDITRLFSPLLKELFLIIAIYTLRTGRGISSEQLNEILWHNKSDKDAKNNRSVNIVKLKSILEKVGNSTINKDSGYWQFVLENDDIYVDYKKYASLVHASPGADKEHLYAILDIIKRGPFLSQIEYNWLDDIKSEVSNFIINSCLSLIRKESVDKNPEFIIEITNYIFYFDKLNEDALIYKCKSLISLKRHTLASNAYQKFSKEYKDIYGEDFGKLFHEIIT